VLSQYYFGDRNMISPSSFFSSAKIENINWHSSKSLHFSSGKKNSHINFHCETLTIHNTILIKIHINVLQKKKWHYYITFISMIVFAFIVVQPSNQL